MDDYEKYKKMAEDLRKFAMENDVIIVCATQQPKPPGPVFRLPRPVHDIVFIDHIGLLKDEKKKE